MKKKISKIFAIAVAAMTLTQLVVPAFAETTETTEATDKCTCPEESRTLELIGTSSPTCKDIGLNTYICNDCGKNVYEGIPRTDDHNWSGAEIAENPATCLETGTKTHKRCTICDAFGLFDGNEYIVATAEDLVIDALGHDYSGNGTVITPPSCLEGGYTTYICQREKCGEKHTDNETEAHGHNMVTIPAQKADCTQIGWNEYKACDYEDCDYKEGYVEIPREIHIFDMEIVPATCTSEGTITYICTHDGCPRQGKPAVEILEKLEHTWLDVAESAPKCEVDGNVAYKYCTGCFEVDGDDTVYSSLEEIKEAKKIEALEHTLIPVGAKDPTCTEVGYDFAIVCTTCNEVLRTKLEIPALDHDWVDVEAKRATCDEDGHSAHKDCSRCDAVSGKKVYEMLGHQYKETGYVPATCENDGFIVWECERQVESAQGTCGHVYREIIPAINHEGHMVTVEGKEPTCIEDGWKEFSYCDNCDKFGTEEEGKISKENKIDALGHAFEAVEALAPTYGKDGHEAGEFCTRCKYFGAEIIPALNESFNFSMELTGINGVDMAVVSGYVYANIYLNIEKDMADLNDLTPIIHLAMAELNINYDENSFEFVSIEEHLLEHYEVNAEAGTLSLLEAIYLGAPDVEISGDENGSVLFATLKFKVKGDINVNYYDFTIIAENIDIGRVGEYDNTLTCTTDDNIRETIYVRNLGDVDTKTGYNVQDLVEMSKYFADPEANYSVGYVFDMDKDGDIDGEDYRILMNAIVGNVDFLN